MCVFTCMRRCAYCWWTRLSRPAQMVAKGEFESPISSLWGWRDRPLLYFAMAVVTGLEPAVFGVTDQRFIHLSYTTIFQDRIKSSFHFQALLLLYLSYLFDSRAELLSRIITDFVTRESFGSLLGKCTHNGIGV